MLPGLSEIRIFWHSDPFIFCEELSKMDYFAAKEHNSTDEKTIKWQVQKCHPMIITTHKAVINIH